MNKATQFSKKNAQIMTDLSDDYVCFEVFVRSQNALEYKHSSRLHALDPRHALLLARDCYARRSEAKSIWVIASHCIYDNLGLTLTQSTHPTEWERDGDWDHSTDTQLFEVFAQLKSGLEYRHIASIWADSYFNALDKSAAVLGEAYKSLPKGGIWLARAADVMALQNEDKAYFMASMLDKKYRYPTFYQLPEAVNHM